MIYVVLFMLFNVLNRFLKNFLFCKFIIRVILFILFFDFFMSFKNFGSNVGGKLFI